LPFQNSLPQIRKTCLNAVSSQGSFKAAYSSQHSYYVIDNEWHIINDNSVAELVSEVGTFFEKTHNRGVVGY
jgi:hypothetical protein